MNNNMKGQSQGNTMYNLEQSNTHNNHSSWQNQQTDNMNQMNMNNYNLPSSGLSLDHRSIGESYENEDSLSDISTEKSATNNNNSSSNNNNHSTTVKRAKTKASSNAKNNITHTNMTSTSLNMNTTHNTTNMTNTMNNNTTNMSITSDLEQRTKSKNREHAKKTRIRKKNYIESLKETVKMYSNERERIDRDSRITLSRLAEQVCIVLYAYSTIYAIHCMLVYMILYAFFSSHTYTHTRLL